MKIKSKPCGDYATNCYIIDIDNKQIIIDPGVNATNWVKDNVTNPIVILNTHGHFDHVWSNQELKNHFNIPIYIQKDDAFMLENDPFSQGTPKSIPDILVDGNMEYEVEGIKFEFIKLPGHTPGCSVITIEDSMFSGDFLFKGSIGRVDFPYSNPDKMKKSINNFLKIEEDYTVYPGHGDKTSVSKEKNNLKNWLNYL
jgi:glyoxylase-like metal-dependent hydrolase (beta-lactamase superfamily II)